MYDIAIIGAGPSGSTLARYLSGNYRVCILDYRDLGTPYVGGRSKSCGGLLAPDAQAELCRQGLSLPGGLLEDPQLFAVRTLDLQTSCENYYQRYYYNMDREGFDRWLFSQIPHGVKRVTGAWVKEIKANSQGWNLNFNHNGSIQSLNCRVLIGADGANSLVRRFLYGDSSIRQYISYQQWFEAHEAEPYYGAFFDSAISDFYSWGIYKNKCLILGSAMPVGQGVRRRFEILKGKLRNHGYRWGRHVKSQGALISRPKTPGEIKLGHGYAGLIGEAAGLISPSSAEGISYALKSARFMADALNEDLPSFEIHYRRKCANLIMSILSKWMKSPGMYNPVLRNMVLSSGMGSIKKPEGKKENFNSFGLYPSLRLKY